jgi:CDP-6-deoxy-D-xylo-4-hexulose-3-dehydrase
MICTNDENLYEQLRMLRSHGMVRESSRQNTRLSYQQENPELNPDFIFAYPAYNVRNTEIGGILGRSQLKRLDRIVARRVENHNWFLSGIDSRIYKTDFEIEGSSNYAFNLILKNPDMALAKRVMERMTNAGIEFRRGSAGGGNQLRQPYLKGVIPKDYHTQFPKADHIHFYGFYIGNFPDLTQNEVDEICSILNV